MRVNEDESWLMGTRAKSCVFVSVTRQFLIKLIAPRGGVYGWRMCTTHDKRPSLKSVKGHRNLNFRSTKRTYERVIWEGFVLAFLSPKNVNSGRIQQKQGAMTCWRVTV